MHITAGHGVAVREFPPKTGFADYLLLLDRAPFGVIEAKLSKSRRPKPKSNACSNAPRACARLSSSAHSKAGWFDSQ
ncbi:MAG: hypothetical protein HY525_15670 [Betaproteobacteria bacterium]|nr:hypothetical protein [Betaproteobacteria bacterium]